MLRDRRSSSREHGSDLTKPAPAGHLPAPAAHPVVEVSPGMWNLIASNCTRLHACLLSVTAQCTNAPIVKVVSSSHKV